MKYWYYWEEDQPKGPIADDEFIKLCGSGSIPGTSLVWSEGMLEWAEACTIARLPGSLSPPPLPVGPPPLPSAFCRSKPPTGRLVSSDLRVKNVVSSIVLVTVVPALLVAWFWAEDFISQCKVDDVEPLDENAVFRGILLCIFFFLLWPPMISAAWLIAKLCRFPLPKFSKKMRWIIVSGLGVPYMLVLSYYLDAPAMAPYRLIVMNGSEEEDSSSPVGNADGDNRKIQNRVTIDGTYVESFVEHERIIDRYWNILPDGKLQLTDMMRNSGSEFRDDSRYWYRESGSASIDDFGSSNYRIYWDWDGQWGITGNMLNIVIQPGASRWSKDLRTRYSFRIEGGRSFISNYPETGGRRLQRIR
jgi:hypothetical protein